MKKSILIIYTSAGYGHKKIAENIATHLRRDCDVELKNLFEVEKGAMVDGGTNLYLWIINKIPWLWEFFYTNNIFLNCTLPFRRFAASFKSKKVLDILNAKHYDAVICTQVNASSILSYLKLKNKYAGKFIVTFSDFHLHRFWLFDNVDLYLANIPEQKEQMIRLGIPAEKIAVCGITLAAEWPTIDTAAVRGKYNLAPTDKIILLLGGGRGLGIDENLLVDISNIDERLDAHFFLVCGKNENLFKAMQKRFAHNSRMHVLGFINTMDELYSVADLAITKPGGLSVAECLKYYLPILIYSFIPGQEKLNYDYLTQKKLLFPVPTGSAAKPGVFSDAVAEELRTGAFRKTLRQNANVHVIVQDGTVVTASVERVLS